MPSTGINSGYEYRVCWKWEYEGRLRTRLYQTWVGASDFVRFLNSDLTPAPDTVLEHNMAKLGGLVEVWVEERPVGDWRPA